MIRTAAALLLALALGACAGLTHDAADEARAIRAVLVAQQEAWNRGDIDAFMEGYWKSSGLRFVSGDRVTQGWTETRDRYRATYDSPAKMGRLEFSGLDVTMLGEEAALVFGRWRLERAGDAPGGVFTLTFRKLDGRWVIVLDHTS